VKTSPTASAAAPKPYPQYANVRLCGRLYGVVTRGTTRGDLVTFTIAVQKNPADKAATLYPCQAWDALADAVQKEGRHLRWAVVEGSLELNQWVNGREMFVRAKAVRFAPDSPATPPPKPAPVKVTQPELPLGDGCPGTIGPNKPKAGAPEKPRPPPRGGSLFDRPPLEALPPAGTHYTPDQIPF